MTTDAFTETKHPDTKEIGATGTTFFSGSLAENEYNTDLRGAKGRAVYEKMRRSDSRVKAALMVCELPLRSAPWDIEPASEEQADVDIADALKANLFEGMSITWDSFMHHCLLMLSFGFMPFEKVWKVTDEGVRIAKLAPRLPSSLYRWLLDDNGGLLGIEQFVQIGTTFKFVTIPVEKLLVFTNDKEGANFEGVSILRTAYKHWYYKDQLYRIDGIAAERHALGIPVITLPSGASEADKAAADKALARMYAHEQQYLRLSEGQEFDVKGLSGTVRDIMPSIEHHDKKIAECVLADFLDLGGSDSGSWALSKDKTTFFLLALKAVAANVTDTINAYLVKPWVDFNYADVKAYPKLTCGKLETRDIEKYVTAISGLITSGGLTPDRDTENTLREALELPELPEETPTASEARVAAQAQAEADAKVRAEAMAKGEQATDLTPEEVAEAAKLAEAIPATRPLTPAEQCVNFAEIDDTLNRATVTIADAVKAVQQKQVAKLVDVAMKLVQAKDFSKLTDIDVPFRSEVATAIEKELLGVYEYGRGQVRQELAKQGVTLAEPWPSPLTPDQVNLIKAFLASRAKATANQMAAKLKQAVVYEGMSQIKQGTALRNAMEEAVGGLSDKELLTAVGNVVPEAFGFGRSSQAEEMAQEIGRVQYSALLDQGTCGACAPLDGQEWDYSDPRTDEYARGNPKCQGRGRCRCIEVYISRQERRNPR